MDTCLDPAYLGMCIMNGFSFPQNVEGNLCGLLAFKMQERDVF